MSLFTDASLVYVPSGVKDGKTYSIKPTDGSGDLTFSRGSDIEATRVNANGYIEKAQVNLLLRSNSFDILWTKTNLSVTSGQSGYDGTSDAWLLNVTGGTGSQQIKQTISSSGLTTYSVYLKAGTTDWVALRATGSPVSCLVWFDLSTGTKGSNQNAVDYSITSVGSGWYRCTLTTTTTIDSVFIYPATADDLAGLNCTSGDNIYIQDAQLNYGLVAQTYQETTTTAVVTGITDNTPRLNYDPANPTCPSLLLEPSRQNIFPHSDLLTAWTQDSATTTANQTTSPEGVVNGSLITATGATSIDHTIYVLPSLSASTHTFSAYVKKNTQRYVNLTFNRQADSNEWATANFDLDSGTSANYSNILATPTSTITAVGSGWYRITLTATLTTSASTLCFLGFSQAGAPNTSRGRYAFISSDSFYAYGLQCELGSYVSSIVPTYGASATRTNERPLKTGINSLIGGTSGTIFYEIHTNPNMTQASYKQLFYYIDASAQQGYVYVNSSNYIVTNGNLGNMTSSITLAQDTTYKIAIAYAPSDFKLYVNGAEVASSTSGTPKDFVDILSIGSYAGASEWNEFGFKQILHFKSRLSNSELATLTA